MRLPARHERAALADAGVQAAALVQPVAEADTVEHGLQLGIRRRVAGEQQVLADVLVEEHGLLFAQAHRGADGIGMGRDDVAAAEVASDCGVKRRVAQLFYGA